MSDLARGVDEILAGSSGTPLVLVADEALSGMFAKDFSGEVVRSPATQQSPGNLNEEDLHEIAWAELSERRLASDEDALSSLFAHYKDADSEKAATNLDDIAMAAVMGRIDTMFFDPSVFVSGTVDRQTGAVEKLDESDLIDDLARLTLTQGGQLLPVDRNRLPDDCAAAALFRF